MEKKILVVDDEKPIADILQFNLKKEGYEVHARMMAMKPLRWRRKSSRILCCLISCFRIGTEWKFAVRFERSMKCQSLC